LFVYTPKLLMRDIFDTWKFSIRLTPHVSHFLSLKLHKRDCFRVTECILQQLLNMACFNMALVLLVVNFYNCVPVYQAIKVS